MHRFGIFTELYNHHCNLILEPNLFHFLNNKEDLLVHVQGLSNNETKV